MRQVVELIREALNFRRPAPPGIIVSLTTFPSRIEKTHLVIQSLLNQTLPPEKIVLYLSLCEFPDRAVPQSLARLESGRFAIRFVRENLRPYQKLVFALEESPGRWIATFDDDRIYSEHCLERLWDAALKTPNTIVCISGRRPLVKDGVFKPYVEWPIVRSGEPSFWIMPLGTNGVLYPPGSLHPLTGDRRLIKRLAPEQDDIWFKVMSLKQNIPCRAIGGDQDMPPLEFKENTRLWDTNRVKNDGVWHEVLGHFGMTPKSLAALERQLSA